MKTSRTEDLVNPKLIINEVDCYIGNSCNYYKFATDGATQHQFILKEGNTETCIGFRNYTADDDRGERIVLEIPVSKAIVKIWKECESIKEEFLSEYCESKEDYDFAHGKNAPLLAEIKSRLTVIHSEIKIDMPLDQFLRLSIY